MALKRPVSHQEDSRLILDALLSAPPALRQAAREAIEAGNQETFIALVTEGLRSPDAGALARSVTDEVLLHADWDWIAAEFFAESPVNQP